MAAHTENGAAPALACHGICVAFTGSQVLDDVSITLAQSEIVGLIGPNGAGKTTLINVLSGFVRPRPGWLRVGGRDMTGARPHQLARSGVGRTFQGGRLFGRLTVAENVRVAAVAMGASRREARRRAEQVLDELALAGQADEPAASLSYGDERRLALARTLATEPRFLLLDEPAAGLNEAETARLIAAVRLIPHTHRCGVLVVEHDMGLIMSLSDRVHVLAHGRTLSVGTPAEVRADAAVVAAYLGTAEEKDRDAAR